MTLVLLSYNNYYNRIVKRHETLNDYLDDSAIEVATVSGVAFNPNDGVTTSQIVNADFSSVAPDYLLCLDDNSNIVGRWYILEASRTRQGQYILELLRDLVADSYDKLLTAPMFVEKATLTRNDARIFNNEAMSFNRIKTSETLLKDAIKVPWIVGYIARNTADTTVSVPAANIEVDYELSSLNGYQYYQYTYENPYKMSYSDFTGKMYFRGLGWDSLQVGWDTWGYPKMPSLEVDDGQITFPPNGSYCDRSAGPAVKGLENYGSVMDQINDHTYNTDWIGPSYETTGMPRNPMDLSDEGGKIIKVGTTFYEIQYNTRVTDTTLVEVSSSSQYGLMYKNVIDKCNKLNANDIVEPVGAIEYKAVACYFTYKILELESISVEIDSTRGKSLDSPYDIFAIPYGSIKFTNYSGTAPTITGEAGLALAQAFSPTLDKKLYDIQLLPYCPVDIMLNGINMQNKREHIDYEWIRKSDDNNTIVSIMFWVRKSSFQRGIAAQITVPEDAVNFKVANECDSYRIVSPTYSGEFEFSATKNNGVDSFIAMCTYKPYNPFIKIAPVFRGLYGQEFKDGRGCICQGDFSLPQTSDAWVQYQINNKNYLNAFNRQIENMNVNNSVQRELEKWQVGGGTVAGAASGAMAGSMMGGGYGAAAGAVVGAGASLFGGLKDISLAEKLRQEALDYTKDQFGYQLGNIAALPYSLGNIGSLTHISKYFPILEYYTCTDIEKQALKDKIKYNGMSVGTVGTIQEFIQSEPSYIKGKLIRLEDIGEEFHYVNALANELNKGVFI